MKNNVVSLAAVVLMATTTQAATIGLRWQDTPSAQEHNGPGTVEIWVDMIPGDEIASAGADAKCISDDCSNLVLSNWTAVAPNWTFGGIDGAPGAPNYAGTWNGANTPADVIHGPQTGFVLGTFDVSFTGDADGSESGFGLSWHSHPGGGVIDATARSLTWDTRYHTIYSGYITYGDYGTPSWNCDFGCWDIPSIANPLIITKVPEPTSLALFALGGFALLRCAHRPSVV